MLSNQTLWVIAEHVQVKNCGSLFNQINYKTLWIIIKPDQVKDCESLLNVIKFNFVDHHWT